MHYGTVVGKLSLPSSYEAALETRTKFANQNCPPVQFNTTLYQCQAQSQNVQCKVELETGSVLYQTALWDCVGDAIASFIGSDEVRTGNWVNVYLLKTAP